MNKFINLFLDISPSLTIAHYGFLPRTSCLNGLFMENEYIHIIFDDHELHALSSLGTRYALAHAYQQVLLDDESKKLTTINTTKGLFQYEQLPFGVAAAPSIFQRLIESLLQDLPRVAVYIDDIIVAGTSVDDHLANLEKVMAHLLSAGLTVRKSKCVFAASSIEYLGHMIDAEGLRPSEEKVRAIRDAPEPQLQSVSQLKSFLGILNYYSKFLPN